MKLEEDQKKKIHEVFQDIYEASDRAKSYNEHIKEVKKELARELDVSVEVIANSYSAWVRGIEKPDLVKKTEQILSVL